MQQADAVNALTQFVILAVARPPARPFCCSERLNQRLPGSSERPAIGLCVPLQMEPVASRTFKFATATCAKFPSLLQYIDAGVASRRNDFVTAQDIEAASDAWDARSIFHDIDT